VDGSVARINFVASTRCKRLPTAFWRYRENVYDDNEDDDDDDFVHERFAFWNDGAKRACPRATGRQNAIHDYDPRSAREKERKKA
jgi:hypothetical protein